MKIFYKTVLTLLIFTFSQFLSAQEEIQYTQYMYTPSLLNPAFVGMREEMNISIIHRSQWVGVNGAPISQSLVFDTPINDNVGFGLNVLHDKIGPAQVMNVTMDVSYLLQLNNNGLKLSFGMKGGGQLLNVDFNKLLVNDPNDEGLKENINSRFSPTIGTGVYLYNQQWYVGLSTPNFLISEHYNKTLVSSVANSTHYYLIGGINFDINNQVKLKPTVLFKGVAGSPLSMDLSLNALINEAFTVGVSYRKGASISGLFDVKVNSNLSIGYSYDYATTAISNFSGGSHEILLRWNVYRLFTGVHKPTWFY